MKANSLQNLKSQAWDLSVCCIITLHMISSRKSQLCAQQPLIYIENIYGDAFQINHIFKEIQSKAEIQWLYFGVKMYLPKTNT